MNLSPQPRYRLYTTAASYAAFLRDPKAGDDVARLEAAMTERLGVAHALAAPRARVGIYLALKALIRPGQEVILSPYTIADVVNMVLAAGGIPRFADIERETCNIAAAEVARLLGPATGAVLVTHLHGLACPIEEIAAMCSERGVPLVEDCAQAFGTRVGGRSVGTFGDAGVFSFGMYKNVNTFFGGMIVTPRADLRDRMARESSTWPLEQRRTLVNRAWQSLTRDVSTTPGLFQSLVYPIFRYGFLNDVRAINKRVEIELDLARHDTMPEHYHRRMTPGQARLALRQLDGVDAASTTRIAYAKVYHRGLAGLPGLVIPPLREDGSHIYTYFPVQWDDRKQLLRWAMRHHRDFAAQHYKNCADLDSFAAFHSDCPNARAVATSLIMLPTYPRYGLAEVERNVEVIRAFFEGRDGAPRLERAAHRRPAEVGSSR